jgi:arginine decarboxylase
MDHNRAPVLEALQEFRRRGDHVFGPPGHRQGRGADPRVVEVVGEGVFATDVLSLNGHVRGHRRRRRDLPRGRRPADRR